MAFQVHKIFRQRLLRSSQPLSASCSSGFSKLGASRAQSKLSPSSRLGMRNSALRICARYSHSNAPEHISKPFKEIQKEFAKKKTLYVPDLERDSCGVGLIANLQSKSSHKVVEEANQMLSRMSHRGGTGAEPNTGDGAGMLLAMPDAFFRNVMKSEFNRDVSGDFSVGMVFFPVDKTQREECKTIFQNIVESNGFELLGWRQVPTNNSDLGKAAKLSEPDIQQAFLVPKDLSKDTDVELKLLQVRNFVSNAVEAAGLEDFYVCSLSGKTVTYKGQLTPSQLGEYFLDHQDPDFKTHFALVHSRFSTNTFPSWDRAQPNRMLCHNGEINTLRGNKNWMNSRSKSLRSPLVPASEANYEQESGLFPLCPDSQTDSGNVDSVVELLSRGSGRSISESMMLLIPEAWQNNPGMDAKKRDFYRFNSCVMEPWDGPAMMAFTDGTQLGACLDRNGLRPSRFYVTKDDHVMLSSEVGVLPQLDVDSIKERGRLEPGKIFLVDFERGEIVKDREVKDSIASKYPYSDWVIENLVSFEDIKGKVGPEMMKKESIQERYKDEESLLRTLNSFGHTAESMDIILSQMAADGKDPIGSMGVDTPLAVLSQFPKQLSEFFKQLFAQVTNPPIDPIREEIVMSLKCPVGPTKNLLDITSEHCRRLELEHPILTEGELKVLTSNLGGTSTEWSSATIDATFDVAGKGQGLAAALDAINEQAKNAIENDGARIIVLSHRNASKDLAGVPSLLAIGSLNHFLIENSLRSEVALVVDCADAKEVHDFCTLVGFGADAICPYLSMHAIEHLNNTGRLENLTSASAMSNEQAVENYKKAIGKGMLKVMAKMGISTLQSYKGAQIFEAVGLSEEVVDKCFKGTTTRIQGATFDALAEDIRRYQQEGLNSTHRVGLVRNVGDYHYRFGGEAHQNSPEAMAEMQVAVRNFDADAWKRYSAFTSRENEKVSLRGLFNFKTKARAIDISEVEPASEIIKRFATGAMSLGSISAEAHETLAIAMNRLHAKSNTGEGGEDPVRFVPLANGDTKRSAIKQVASGRFGVTAEYLANSDQIQIKMAQGAKPGEGGELPGHKVSTEIARVRGTTPGVGLISPPPHHDIYSIEDLAQLIYELKNANSSGDVSVKLVSEVGVGIVAAGVAKAKADHIVVSGGDGGTGAAAWTGVHRAGLPWELGVAETQQTLLVNNLRARVKLQADGQMKTGRDVIMAAILGAEEFGFATAPLIALGCIMMRKCHLNTCPVGIATQDPVLRQKFMGMPEHAVNFFLFLAEEIRAHMASMGIKRFQDLIGRTDLLEIREELLHYKSQNLDLSPLLVNAKELNPYATPFNTTTQDHQLEAVLDRTLISEAKGAIENGDVVYLEKTVDNENRALGTMLSSKIAKKYGSAGLPDGTINVKLRGSAGQGFGFILAKGVTFELEGDANDSVGKGLCGGRIVIYPSKNQTDKEGYEAEKNVIIGNVGLYGATQGEAFFRGKAGERFCVRNSGARCVVEGVGDHGCEYMTGGEVVVLGETGRNFAAGMSGGVAYVYDPNGVFESRCNKEMVSLEKMGVDYGFGPAATEQEMENLLDLIERHRRFTGSAVAKKVITNWDSEVSNFVKVMPNDYKAVLMKKYEQQGQESFAMAG